jgi:hypothetical protein
MLFNKLLTRTGYSFPETCIGIPLVKCSPWRHNSDRGSRRVLRHERNVLCASLMRKFSSGDFENSAIDQKNKRDESDPSLLLIVSSTV